MWDVFNVTMVLSMVATIISILFSAITGAWDFLFPSEPPVT